MKLWMNMKNQSTLREMTTSEQNGKIQNIIGENYFHEMKNNWPQSMSQGPILFDCGIKNL
jgi:hypothetical protein